MLVQSKRHDKRAILQKAEQRVLGLWEAREQIDRFREYRLADEKRRVQFLDARSSP